MRKTFITIALAVTAAVTSQALAQSQQAAQVLFDQGKWQEAANAAAALGTSEGLALAAEATTAGAGLVPDAQKKALFTKAQDYAKQAIAKNPNSADAYFELARAQGRLAQFVGIVESSSIATEMKKNLDQALKLNPKMAGAYVALGLWHSNLVAKLGFAAGLKGANKNQVIPNFKKAIELEPDVAIHRIEYVNAMQLLGNKDKAFAVSQLEKAISIPANTYWEKRDLEQAKAMLAKLK